MLTDRIAHSSAVGYDSRSPTQDGVQVPYRWHNRYRVGPALGCMAGPPAPKPVRAPSRCPSHPDLPDPLVGPDGESIETPAQWERRRDDIEQLFRQYVYGYAPAAVDLDIEVRDETPVLDGRARLREVELSVRQLPSEGPSIHLAVFLPEARDIAPVMLTINKHGNHATIPERAVTKPPAARAHSPVDRGDRAEYWCVEEIVSRGYAFATFHCADVDPDRDDFTDGIHPYFASEDLPGPPGAEWGTIGAWAWGVERCVDYLVDAPGIDGDAIAVQGHSRRGKTALLAGATDGRIAIVIPHQSGTGGVALSRDNGQETVARITARFPHWFADTFHGFAGRADRLPVDQHLLVALVAPRPLLDTEGARDYWANPGLALDSLRAAAPVYDLYDGVGMRGNGLLHAPDPIDESTAGRLVQYRHETGHTLNANYWETILDFTDLHLRESSG